MTNKAHCLRYKKFPPEVTAFSTERTGGFSSGAYSSFNCNPFYGDDEQAVCQNQALLCRDLGISSDRIFLPEQIHGTNICVVDESLLSASEEERKRALSGVDALISDLPQCCLAVSTADCIPVLLYDRQTHAVAAIHAGWRGTVARIVKHVLNRMNEVYSTHPSEVTACIGPGISLNAFEVGDEVYEAFATAGFPMETIAVRKEKWHIDLWEANRLQLLEAGVEADSIELVGVCTYTEHERFFSARRLGLRSGRIVNGIIRK